MNRRRCQIMWIILVVVFSTLCSGKYMRAEENATLEKANTKKGIDFVEEPSGDEDWYSWENIFGDETTTEETEAESTTPNSEHGENPTLPETTLKEEVTTRRGAEPVTKKSTKGNEAPSDTVCSAVSKAVITIVKLSKAGKKKAKIYVFAEGKYKTKKTKITVTIQVKKAGKWKSYKVIKKTKNSFCCTIKKKFRITKKQSYRAYVKIYYYNKKKKKIGSYKKKSKVLLT